MLTNRNGIQLIYVFGNSFSGQLLSYLIVIDFESTCWENKKGFQEISKSVVWPARPTPPFLFIMLRFIVPLHKIIWRGEKGLAGQTSKSVDE